VYSVKRYPALLLQLDHVALNRFRTFVAALAERLPFLRSIQLQRGKQMSLNKGKAPDPDRLLGRKVCRHGPDQRLTPLSPYFFSGRASIQCLNIP
jgi:hypothetical protein